MSYEITHPPLLLLHPEDLKHLIFKVRLSCVNFCCQRVKLIKIHNITLNIKKLNKFFIHIKKFHLPDIQPTRYV